MTTASLHARATTEQRPLAVRGWWCAAAGVIGAMQGAAVLAWPHQVASSRYSFPFTATGDVVAQATFFLQHLPLVLAVATLAGLPTVRGHRVARSALVAGAVGLGLLALMELVAMVAAGTSETSTLGVTISALYSVPVLLSGAGLTVAGVALLRRPLLGRPVAWTLLLLGTWVFVGLTPALSTNGFVLGRIAIMVWMLGFAVLGVTMVRRAS